MWTKQESSPLLALEKHTVAEAAIHFRVSTRTVRRWIKMGKIKTIRPSHFHLITGTEIERLLSSQRG